MECGYSNQVTQMLILLILSNHMGLVATIFYNTAYMTIKVIILKTTLLPCLKTHKFVQTHRMYNAKSEA